MVHRKIPKSLFYITAIMAYGNLLFVCYTAFINLDFIGFLIIIPIVGTVALFGRHFILKKMKNAKKDWGINKKIILIYTVTFCSIILSFTILFILKYFYWDMKYKLYFMF